ncbi:MAG: TonB-dependent receptor [Alphaproteobacteria bacterium]|nr:TonB-dependent receptor [Alphaproteobacteria bacterium]MCB9795997.1 TonB-dependent receptor [Alphaproteobacteria bacterium]
MSAIPLALLGFALAQDEAPGAVIVVEEEVPEGPDPSATSMALTRVEINEDLPASADLGLIVESASGASVQRLGGLGDWSGVSIRGASVRHTLVAIDGIPLNPDGAAAVNLSELPLWAFQRVEIYRGNSPPQLGASAMGGVVNLVSGDAGQAGASGSMGLGSFTTLRSAATVRAPGSLRGLPTQTLVVVEGLSTEADYRYFADNGTEFNLLDDHVRQRQNNDKAQLNAHALWSLQGAGWRLRLLDAFLTREEGLGGHVNSPTTAVRLGTTRNLLAAQASGQRGVMSGEFRAWGLLREERFQDPLGEIGTGSQDQRDRTSALGLSTHGAWLPTTWLAPSLTLSARRDGFQRLDYLTGAEGPARSRWSLSGAAGAQAFAWDGRLVGSLVTNVTYLNTQSLDAEAPSAQVAWLPSPRAGLLLRPSESLALKSNLSYAYRPPDFTELFGDRGAVIGNPELGPERGLQGDLALRWTLPAQGGLPTGALEAGVFVNRTWDQIVYVQNAQRTQVPVNLDDARTRGAELALSLEAGGWLESRSSLTWNDSLNLSSDPAEAGKQLPRVPRWQASQWTALSWGERLRLGHTYTYIDGNYWDRTNFYRAAPRHLHGVFLRAQPAPGAPSLELSVVNALDRLVQVVPRNPLDPEDEALIVQPMTDFVGYPLPGRALQLTLRWEAPTALSRGG